MRFSAYTMFNAFLPKLLEKRLGGMNPEPSLGGSAVGIKSGESSLEDSLWDVVIYSIGGCPGAIVSAPMKGRRHRTRLNHSILAQLGAYLVDSPFGRRWSLAGSTFLTAFFCAVFVKVDSPLLLKASTVGTSLASTTMWGILYGWTPEIFSTNVRGSACGIASALSRMCVSPHRLQRARFLTSRFATQRRNDRSYSWWTVAHDQRLPPRLYERRDLHHRRDLCSIFEGGRETGRRRKSHSPLVPVKMHDAEWERVTPNH